MIKSLLQQLTNNSSEILSELYQNFKNQYPSETDAIDLLRHYVYSEDLIESAEPELEKILTNLLKGKV